MPEPSCRMCEQRYPHFPKECGIPCEGGEPHDVVATYRHSGFWRGECRRCHKVWEVDSSG